MQTCSKCNGNKRVPCGFCYDGQITLNCTLCQTNGYILLDDGSEAICSKCKGTKTYYPPSCAKCDNSSPCDMCSAKK